MEEIPICLTSSGEKDKTDNFAPKHEDNAVEVVNLIQAEATKGNL